MLYCKWLLLSDRELSACCTLIKLVVPSFWRLQGVTGQPRHCKMMAFRSPTFVIRHFYIFIYLFNAAPTLSSVVCWIAWAENSVRPCVRASVRAPGAELPSSKKKLAELPSPKFPSGGLKCLNHPLGTSEKKWPSYLPRNFRTVG